MCTWHISISASTTSNIIAIWWTRLCLKKFVILDLGILNNSSKDIIKVLCNLNINEENGLDCQILYLAKVQLMNLAYFLD